LSEGNGYFFCYFGHFFLLFLSFFLLFYYYYYKYYLLKYFTSIYEYNLIFLKEEMEEEAQLHQTAIQNSTQAYGRHAAGIAAFDEKFEQQRKTNLAETEVNFILCFRSSPLTHIINRISSHPIITSHNQNLPQ
jgi:hypothetical protein